MSESPENEMAELRAEVAALSAVVTALFASTVNLNSTGKSDHLAFYADAISRAGQAHPERVAAIVNRVVQQASAATEAFRESR